MFLDIPIETLIKLAAALFGLIFGIIFLTDGWYASSEDPGFLGSSPKVKGLLFLLGGGVIPALTDYFSPAGEAVRGYATVIYAVVLSLTTILGVFILAVYAFILSANRIHDLIPNRKLYKRCIDSTRFSLIAVRKGSDAFYEQMNREYSYIKKLNHQREESLILFNGIYAAMVDNNVKHIGGVDNFVKFITLYLKYFLDDCLMSYSDNNVAYRACIYFHDRENNIEENSNIDSDSVKKLYFLTGVDPSQRTPFSMSPLSYEDSFAGWVLKNSVDTSQVFSYVRHKKKGKKGKSAIKEAIVPFQKRNPTGAYKSIISYAIRPLKHRKGLLPRMVLCIDCSESNLGLFAEYSEDKEYIESILSFLCTAFAIAQASMGVSSTQDTDRSLSIASWIKTKDGV